MTDADDPRDYEREWEGLDEKVILAQILAELQQIRLLLSNAESAAQSDGSETDTYRCVKCDATVPAAERERHAHAEHRAPPGGENALFESV